MEHVEFFDTYLIQAGQNMGQVDDRVALLIHLMENVVPEELDDVPIPSL